MGCCEPRVREITRIFVTPLYSNINVFVKTSTCLRFRRAYALAIARFHRRLLHAPFDFVNCEVTNCAIHSIIIRMASIIFSNECYCNSTSGVRYCRLGILGRNHGGLTRGQISCVIVGDHDLDRGLRKPESELIFIWSCYSNLYSVRSLHASESSRRTRRRRFVPPSAENLSKDKSANTDLMQASDFQADGQVHSVDR